VSAPVEHCRNCKRRPKDDNGHRCRPCRLSNRRAVRNLRNQRFHNMQCEDCGTPVRGRLCAPCRAKSIERCRKWRREKYQAWMAARKASGLCINCSADREPGQLRCHGCRKQNIRRAIEHQARKKAAAAEVAA